MEMDRFVFARVSRAQKLSVRSRELAAVAGAVEGPPRRWSTREKERGRENVERKRGARSSPLTAYRSDERKKENEETRDKARGVVLCNF